MKNYLKHAFVGLSVGIAGLLSGCVDNTTIVEVKADGSGVVTEVTYMSPAMSQMMTGMAGSMTAGSSGKAGNLEVNAGKSINDMLLDRKQYEAKAKTMGEGVSIMSLQAMKRKDGAPGVRVDYAFKDINTLKVGSGSLQQPSFMSPNEGNMAMGEKKSNPLTFVFVPGVPAKLTVIMPPEAASAKKEGVGPETGAGTTSAEDQAGFAMVKAMLGDFHVALRIKVDGEIKNTNATYVHVGATNHKKQYVTLFDVSFAEMLGDPKNANKLKQMMSMGEDPSAAKKAMKDLPGMKVETAKKVEIEFQ